MEVESHSSSKHGYSDNTTSPTSMIPQWGKVTMVPLMFLFIFGALCGYMATITFSNHVSVIELENDRSSLPFDYIHKRALFNPCTSTSKGALQELVKSRLIDYNFIFRNPKLPDILYLLHSNMSSPLEAASNQIYTFLNQSMAKVARQNTHLQNCINEEIYSSRSRNSQVPAVYADLRHILRRGSRNVSHDQRQREISLHSQNGYDVAFAEWKSEINIKAELSFQQVKEMIFQYRTLLKSMMIPVESKRVGLRAIDAFESKYMFNKWSNCCPEHQLEVNSEAIFAAVRDCIKDSKDQMVYDQCLLGKI